MPEKLVSTSGKQIIAFMFLEITDSLRRPYILVFALPYYCVWNLIHWRDLLTNLLEVFLHVLFHDSTDCQNLRLSGSISPKAVLIFPEIFLDFRYHTIERQDFIDLGSYSGKIYAFIILMLSFLRRRGCNLSPISLVFVGPVGWGSKIQWMDLCKGVRLSQQVSWIWH